MSLGGEDPQTSFVQSPEQAMMMAMMMPMFQNMMSFAMQPPQGIEYGVDNQAPYWSPEFGDYSPNYSYSGGTQGYPDPNDPSTWGYQKDWEPQENIVNPSSIKWAKVSGLGGGIMPYDYAVAKADDPSSGTKMWDITEISADTAQGYLGDEFYTVGQWTTPGSGIQTASGLGGMGEGVGEGDGEGDGGDGTGADPGNVYTGDAGGLGAKNAWGGAFGGYVDAFGNLITDIFGGWDGTVADPATGVAVDASTGAASPDYSYITDAIKGFGTSMQDIYSQYPEFAGGNLWEIPQGPGAPVMPSAQGLYTGINQPGIPSYNVGQGYDTYGYNPNQYAPGNVSPYGGSQGYNVASYNPQGYNAAQIQSPGGYNVEKYNPQSYQFQNINGPQQYNVQGYNPYSYDVQGFSPQQMAQAAGWNLPTDFAKNPGDFEVPSIAGLQPNTGFWENLDPDIKASVMQPYEEISQQLQEQMGSFGQLGSAEAGLTGAAGKALGEYWVEQAIPNITREAFDLSQPGEQAKFAAELSKAQIFAAGESEQARWVANNTVDINKWEAMTDANRQQWLADANLSSSQFTAMETTKKNATFAAMQTDAERWKAMSETEQSRWYSMAQMDTDKYNSMGATEQAQWDAHVQTEANRWFAMSSTEQNQWEKMMQMDADKWNGMSDNQKRQWDANAQLEADRFTAMSTTEQNRFVAQQDDIMKRWTAKTNADREDMLFRANIDAQQFDAMNKTQQSLWVANAELTQKKDVAEKKWGLNTRQYDLAVEEARTDYNAATNKLQLDYGSYQNQWAQQLQQNQFPWQQLPNFFGAGMSQPQTTPGTQGFNIMSLLPLLFLM